MEIKEKNDLVFHMGNNAVANAGMSEMIQKQLEWHIDRGLITGTDNHVQAVKFLEEYMEFRAALTPKTCKKVLVERVVSELYSLLDKGRIKVFSFEEAEKEREDAIGDMDNMLTGFASRELKTRLHCAESAYNVYKDRKGRMDSSGTWIKEEDIK